MDSTNADVPQAGIQLSGDAARQAAVKRLQKLQGAPAPIQLPGKAG